MGASRARKYSPYDFFFDKFSDHTLTYQCASYCSNSQENCLEKCEDDSECEFTCQYEYASCLFSCPCNEGCPNGCQDCASAFCSCYDYESNRDYVTCLAFYENLYQNCISLCSSGDFLCFAACSRELDYNMENCPCQSNCEGGCPCPDYTCPETTTTDTTTTTISSISKQSVLVFNTWLHWKPAFIIDSNDQTNFNILFNYDADTGASVGCSINWQNNFYIFGGQGSLRRQISQLTGNTLNRIGNLGFDHDYGACATLSNFRIYLCFSNGETDRKKCRYSSSPLGNFTEAASSLFEHNRIRIAASEGFKSLYLDH